MGGLIEDYIYGLIGFLAAALLALLAAPAISRRATRLAARRARLLETLSPEMAQAEVDAMRGRHAVTLAIAEARVEAARSVAADREIEKGRLLAEIAEKDARLAAVEADAARERAAAADLQRRLAEALAENGAREIAMHDLGRQRDAASGDRDAARARLAESENMLDQRRVEAAALKSQIATLRAELTARKAGFGEVDPV